METLRLECVENEAGTWPLREEWDRLAEISGAGAYLSHDWCAAYLKHYCEGRRPTILAFRSAGRLVGVVPVVIDALLIGGARILLGRLMGSDYSPKLLGLPMDPAFARAIMTESAAWLLAQGGCHVILLGPLSAAGEAAQALKAIASEESKEFAISELQAREPVTLFDLPDSFDSFLQRLNKDQRAKARYELRQLDKAFKVEFSLVPEASTEEGFRQFKEMHDRQWQSLDCRGHFGSWPKAFDYNLDVALSAARNGTLRLFRLEADGTPIAYQYAFKFGKTYHWRLPSRRPEPEWRKYSLGRVALLKMIEYAIREAVVCIEAGVGQYEYKSQLGGRELPVVRYLIGKANGRELLAEKLLRLNGLVLECGYHKAYYTRLARRFPRFRKPLWDYFIRTRIQ